MTVFTVIATATTITITITTTVVISVAMSVTSTIATTTSLFALTEVVDLKFDLGLYAPHINLSSKENYYWDRAVLFLSHYGLSDTSVEPFVNLILHEVLCKFSKWNKYCKDKRSYQTLMAYGSNFFCDKEYLKDILKVSS